MSIPKSYSIDLSRYRGRFLAIEARIRSQSDGAETPDAPLCLKLQTDLWSVLAIHRIQLISRSGLRPEEW